MFPYEVLMLTVPEITQDEVKQLEDRLEKTIESFKGVMISFERWGKYRLAYPVKKNDYGVYILARFEIGANPTALLKELSTIFAVKLNEIVMRHMVTRLDLADSLAYNRPHSLEDAPPREVGSFMRDNKGEGAHSFDGRRRFEKTSDASADDDMEDYSAEA
jgi:small subunit ribosomal protein S6